MRFWGRHGLPEALLGADLLGCALLAFEAAPAQAEPAAVVTQQQIEVDGRVLAYSAEAGRTPIRDVSNGEPVGYIFYAPARALLAADLCVLARDAMGDPR
jgi:hypothetical protein